ncbi:hypothetical protein [Methylocucumis oryzae]|nr:hypothetical protein [Methylocucumis oryzae]
MTTTLLKRPYRKIVSIKGVVFIETQEHDVVVQNLSISGALVMFRQTF